MRRVFAIAAVTSSVCLIILPAFAGQLEDTAASEYAAFNQAFNKGDAKGVAALYGSDALLLPPTHDVITGPGIEKFFQTVISSGVKDHTLEIIKVMDSGKTHVITAKWGAKGKDDKGNPTTIGGLATHVFQQQPDGSYKLMLHTFN